jgi:hypothetical protein
MRILVRYLNLELNEGKFAQFTACPQSTSGSNSNPEKGELTLKHD